MGHRDAPGRPVLWAMIAGALLLATAGAASASIVALHHGGSRAAGSTLKSPPASASPSEVAIADLPTLVPTALPTATPSPTAPTRLPTPRPTATTTPRPASATLPRCDQSYLKAFMTIDLQPDYSVLIILTIHHEWGGACSFPRTCTLGWAAINTWDSSFRATNEPVSCTAPWTPWSGDLRVSAVWSTCRDAGDYVVSADYAGIGSAGRYGQSSTQPPGCTPPS